MNKVKINPGLASIALLASLFAGWQTLLLVTVILFGFCEIDEKTKGIATNVIAFFVGYTIITVGWDLIETIVYFIPDLIEKLIGIINNFLSPLNYISISTITGPINYVIGLIGSIVDLLFVIVKLSFIITVLSGKNPRKFMLSGLFNKFIDKAINFINGTVAAAVQPAPQAPVAPAPVQPAPATVQPAPAPAQPVQPAVAPVQQPVAPVQPTQQK